MRQIPVHRSPRLPSLTPWARQRPRCFESRLRGVTSSCIGRWSQFLSECALFRDVTPRDLRVLEEGVRVRSIARGGFYFEQGASPSAIYILTQGSSIAPFHPACTVEGLGAASGHPRPVASGPWRDCRRLSLHGESRVERVEAPEDRRCETRPCGCSAPQRILPPPRKAPRYAGHGCSRRLTV